MNFLVDIDRWRTNDHFNTQRLMFTSSSGMIFYFHCFFVDSMHKYLKKREIITKAKTE